MLSLVIDLYDEAASTLIWSTNHKQQEKITKRFTNIQRV
jgi:hypothetical protein